MNISTVIDELLKKKSWLEAKISHIPEQMDAIAKEEEIPLPKDFKKLEQQFLDTVTLIASDLKIDKFKDVKNFKLSLLDSLIEEIGRKSSPEATQKRYDEEAIEQLKVFKKSWTEFYLKRKPIDFLSQERNKLIAELDSLVSSIAEAKKKRKDVVNKLLTLFHEYNSSPKAKTEIISELITPLCKFQESGLQKDQDEVLAKIDQALCNRDINLRTILYKAKVMLLEGSFPEFQNKVEVFAKIDNPEGYKDLFVNVCIDKVMKNINIMEAIGKKRNLASISSLAKNLASDMNNFVKLIKSNSLTEESIATFEKLFIARAHSEDAVMIHYNHWASVVKRTVLAVITLGAYLLIKELTDGEKIVKGISAFARCINQSKDIILDDAPIYHNTHRGP